MIIKDCLKINLQSAVDALLCRGFGDWLVAVNEGCVIAANVNKLCTDKQFGANSPAVAAFNPAEAAFGFSGCAPNPDHNIKKSIKDFRNKILW